MMPDSSFLVYQNVYYVLVLLKFGRHRQEFISYNKKFIDDDARF